MRCLLVIVILFITGYNVSGSRFGTPSRVKLNRAELGGRTIRAATSCEDAYQETLSPRYELCESYLTPDDNDEYSNAALDKFCSQNCARTLGSVFHDIARFCDDDVSVHSDVVR